MHDFHAILNDCKVIYFKYISIHLRAIFSFFCFMARPPWLSCESSRERLVFLLPICPNLSRLTVYTVCEWICSFLQIARSKTSSSCYLWTHLRFHIFKLINLIVCASIRASSCNILQMMFLSASVWQILTLGIDGFHTNQCIIMQQEFAREFGEISPSICSFDVDEP